ncbi:TPA: hypothetical protein EYG84_01205 [Candidatus Gracilibacteria bacterium]|nr:hypothetical protein [Candidatus Gracilibacteria bacterium]
MNKVKLSVYLFSVAGIVLFSGCVKSDNQYDITPVNTAHIERPDLIEKTFTKSDGTVVKLQTSSSRKVKNKHANIRTNQKFENVKESTLVIESGITEITEYIKESTITVKNGATLKTPYLKKSKVIVEKGGNLEVSERIKDSEIILFNAEDFSVRPSDQDKNSVIRIK